MAWMWSLLVAALLLPLKCETAPLLNSSNPQGVVAHEVKSIDLVAKSMPLILNECSAATSNNQTFSFSTVRPYVNPAAISAMGFCFEIGGSSLGSTVTASPCGHNPMNARANQYWDIAGDYLKSLQVETPFCFGIDKTTHGVLVDCSSSSAEFAIGFNAKGGKGSLVHKQSGLCVTAAGTPPPLPPAPPPAPPSPPNSPCPPLPSPSPPGPPVPVLAADRPCDIYDAAGTPCVAAHSVVRALYRSFEGELYSVKRSSDHASKPIRVSSVGGFADAVAQDEFCDGTQCTIETIFDQSAKGNHLRANHPGRHFPVDRGVNASAHPIVISGHRVYGAWFDEGMGYRNDNTSGLAVGEEPESIYAVFGGGHYNDICCFDYGNAENHIGADGAGTMEAIYFGNATSWWSPQARAGIPASWHGPYIMADIEDGMYAGNDTFNPNNSPIKAEFVSLMLKGHKCEMALKAGDAQAGKLMVKYDGGRPTHADWNPMRKQGGLVLGTGGDNSDRALGIFYEGAMASGYVSAAVEDAVQANIVSAGYRREVRAPVVLM